MIIAVRVLVIEVYWLLAFFGWRKKGRIYEGYRLFLGKYPDALKKLNSYWEQYLTNAKVNNDRLWWRPRNGINYTVMPDSEKLKMAFTDQRKNDITCDNFGLILVA